MSNDICTMFPYQHRKSKFITGQSGQSLDKAPGQSSHTGINIRNGPQLTSNFRNLGAATMSHVVLHYEQVVNLSSADVEVLD